MFQIAVLLTCPEEEGGDWSLSLTGGINGGGEVFICNKAQHVGGEPILDVDLGPDPSGSHTFSFDDDVSPTVHYEVTVVVTI
jgi:hypothetical protein